MSVIREDGDGFHERPRRNSEWQNLSFRSVGEPGIHTGLYILDDQPKQLPPPKINWTKIGAYRPDLGARR